MELQSTTEQHIKNTALLAVTLGRLALVPEMMDAIADGSVGRTAGMLGAVIAADIADGVAARRFGADNNTRRIADAVVDRLTMLAAFGSAITHNPDVLAWYVPLAIRGSLVAVGSNICFWRRNTLVLGGNFHKAASVSQAALGLTLVAEAQPSVLIPVAAATYAINAVSGLDYFGAHKKVIAEPKKQSIERIKVRKLKGLKSLFSSNEDYAIQ